MKETKSLCGLNILKAVILIFAFSASSFYGENDIVSAPDSNKNYEVKWQSGIEKFKNSPYDVVILENEVLYVYKDLRDVHKFYPDDLSKVSVKYATYYVLNKMSGELGLEPCYMMNSNRSFDYRDWVFENGAPMTFYLELTGFRQPNTSEAIQLYKIGRYSSDSIVRYARAESEALLAKKEAARIEEERLAKELANKREAEKLAAAESERMQKRQEKRLQERGVAIKTGKAYLEAFGISLKEVRAEDFLFEEDFNSEDIIVFAIDVKTSSYAVKTGFSTDDLFVFSRSPGKNTEYTTCFEVDGISYSCFNSLDELYEVLGHGDKFIFTNVYKRSVIKYSPSTVEYILPEQVYN